MPGQGDIGGGCCKLNFTVNGTGPKNRHNWSCEDEDSGLNPTLDIWVGASRIPKPTKVMTLAPGQCYRVTLGQVSGNDSRAFLEWTK